MERLHKMMQARDSMLGAAAGAGVGTLAAHALGRSKGVGATLGAAGGSILGGAVGTERALKDQTRQERHVSDRERAHQQRMELADTHQQHRKELQEMRQKKASLDGVMLAAMADELQHIHAEKVAINLAPIGNFLGNIGSKVLSKGTELVGKHAPGMAQGVNAGLLRAGQAVGGGGNLSKVVGGGILGAGALGTAAAARGVMGGGQRR